AVAVIEEVDGCRRVEQLAESSHDARDNVLAIRNEPNGGYDWRRGWGRRRGGRRWHGLDRQGRRARRTQHGWGGGGRKEGQIERWGSRPQRVVEDLDGESSNHHAEAEGQRACYRCVVNSRRRGSADGGIRDRHDTAAAIAVHGDDGQARRGKEDVTGHAEMYDRRRGDHYVRELRRVIGRVRWRRVEDP